MTDTDTALDQQIQALMEQAPQDGKTPDAIKAIAPVLKQVASQLEHPDYFILQTLEQQWMMVTLKQPNQPNATKNVVYAFSSLADAMSNPASKDPKIIAVPVPVVHLLFQMFAMESVNSILFFDVPGRLNKGREVTRDGIRQLIQPYLEQMQQAKPAPPSDLA